MLVTPVTDASHRTGLCACLLARRQVDPSILGGTVVQVGDKTIDLSVSTKLNRLNALLAESV